MTSARRGPCSKARVKNRRVAARSRFGDTSTLATRKTGEEREILLGLAEAEERHASHWQRLLGEDVAPARRGSARMRVLGLLARRFGSVFVLALAQRAEMRSPYAVDSDATAAMAADERVHAEVVSGLAARGRVRGSGTFRAAVIGSNDGLVSNLALIFGVVGGGPPSSAVLPTGLAGLLAGASWVVAGALLFLPAPGELLPASPPNVGTGAARGMPRTAPRSSSRRGGTL